MIRQIAENCNTAQILKKNVKTWILLFNYPCFYYFMPAALAVCTPSLRSCPALRSLCIINTLFFMKRVIYKEKNIKKIPWKKWKTLGKWKIIKKNEKYGNEKNKIHKIKIICKKKMLNTIEENKKIPWNWAQFPYRLSVINLIKQINCIQGPVATTRRLGTLWVHLFN